MNIESFIEKNAPRNRIALLVILDLLIITVSGFLALYIRFDFQFSKMEMGYVDRELKYLPLNLMITLLLFVLFKLYRSVWRFASANEFLNVISACSDCHHVVYEDANACVLLYDEVCDTDSRRREPALCIPYFKDASGKTDGASQGLQEKYNGCGSGRSRRHDY